MLRVRRYRKNGIQAERLQSKRGNCGLSPIVPIVKMKIGDITYSKGSSGSEGRHVADWVFVTRKIFLSIMVLTVLAACNAPPMYGTRAQEYLRKQNVSDELILRLVEGRALTESEAVMLEKFKEHWFQQLFPGNPITAVLHLLAGNPSIPPSMISRLSLEGDEEIRRGVATNPSASLETLLTFRTIGIYSLMNESLSRNPRIPPEVLIEMYRNREANKASFAMNPNCPPELMHDLAEHGGDFEKTWLAANENLLPELIPGLEKDPSENVRRSLVRNKAYKNWKSNKGNEL